MDTMLLLAAGLGLGDLLLVRLWWRERQRRRKAERHANTVIRDTMRLKDALERRAGRRPSPGAVDVPLHAKPREIREALLELHHRQARETGGVA